MTSDNTSERTEQDDMRTECRHCDEEVDIESTDIFKSVSDQFWHRDCFAEHCYQKRGLVATPEGSFKIKPVIIKEIENGKDKVIDSFWRAECPVCYRTHETEQKTEEVRTEFIDTVTSCCDTEWLPPADWIEDCDICGTDHRKSRGCKPITHRDPFPDPDTHHFDCTECEWSGEGDDFDNPSGECPDCGTTAVRAVEMVTDGGQPLGPESGSLARADNWDEFDGDYELVLACGGDEDDNHMVPMEMNWDAATPHGVCPVCGNQAFLHNQEVDA